MISQYFANCIDLYETKSNTAFEGRQLVLSLLYSSKKAKTLSLTENFDFTEACGPIQARQFFKIQARARPEPDPTRKARARLTTLTQPTKSSLV